METNMINASFEANLKMNESYLKALAYQLSKSKDDAQDLLQDTWLRIIENYSNYDHRNKFRSWASVIMKNIFINNFRMGKRHGVSVDIDDAKLCETSSRDYMMADNDIFKAIASLPSEMSSVFNLYLQGYTYEEISHKMSIPLGTVKSRIFCTKKRLQLLLKSYR
ncbi:MAG: RNA polymerase sigma factor [Muribaculaceae bacterium]